MSSLSALSAAMGMAAAAAAANTATSPSLVAPPTAGTPSNSASCRPTGNEQPNNLIAAALALNQQIQQQQQQTNQQNQLQQLIQQAAGQTQLPPPVEPANLMGSLLPGLNGQTQAPSNGGGLINDLSLVLMLLGSQQQQQQQQASRMPNQQQQRHQHNGSGPKLEY